MKIKLAIVLVALILVSSFAGYIVGSNTSYQAGVNDGVRNGYEKALLDVSGLLQMQGVTLDWNSFANGTYQLTVRSPNGQSSHILITANLYVVHKDRYGHVLDTSRGAGTLTNNGKNWTITMLTNNATSLLTGQTGGYYNSSYPLCGTFYLGDATTAGSSATSLVQPTETQLDGMGRAAATSTTVPSLGTVCANVTKTCATAGITIAEWGIYYQVYSATDNSRLNSLIAYDSTPGSKNYAVGDTSAEGWTITFS